MVQGNSELTKKKVIKSYLILYYEVLFINYITIFFFDIYVCILPIINLYFLDFLKDFKKYYYLMYLTRLLSQHTNSNLDQKILLFKFINLLNIHLLRLYYVQKNSFKQTQKCQITWRHEFYKILYQPYIKLFGSFHLFMINNLNRRSNQQSNQQDVLHSHGTWKYINEDNTKQMNFYRL